jgi:NADH-quinone oxidoreductase subunit M
MGGYGFLRLAFPIFPAAAAAASPLLAFLGVVGIVYGALAAWAQEDIKKLVAYSSVSHMGFVVLGISSLDRAAVSGAVFQMVSHGILTGALFLLVGILYERRHTRMISDFGGLARVMPRYAAAFLVISLGSIGLPGLSGFVGEFLILNGSFGAAVLVSPVLWVAIAVVGIVLGAAYMLGLYERVFLGEVTFEENRGLPDLNWREGIAIGVPVLLAVALGLAPGLVLSRIETAVSTTLGWVEKGMLR